MTVILNDSSIHCSWVKHFVPYSTDFPKKHNTWKEAVYKGKDLKTLHYIKTYILGKVAYTIETIQKKSCVENATKLFHNFTKRKFHA